MNPFLILPFKGIYRRHGNEQLLRAMDARFVSLGSVPALQSVSVFI